VSPTEARIFAETLRQTILRESHGRIQKLHIVHDPDSIVVRGTADSYYALQLAIEAVQELRSKQDELAVRFAVTVEQPVTVNSGNRTLPLASNQQTDSAA
jgi:hypothetical protein